MPENTWSALDNPFLASTKGSFKRMNIFATDHHDKLFQAQGLYPVAATLYPQYAPVFNEFRDTMRAYLAAQILYREQTHLVETLFQTLAAEQIRNWDVRIQVQYPNDTATYLGLLPNGRGPFQTGAYEMRAQAVYALSDVLVNRGLDTLQAEVLAAAQALTAARTRQQGHERQVAELSDRVEADRQRLAVQLHANLSLLTYHFINNLSLVESFFELKYIRRNAANEAEVPEEGLDEE